MRELNLSEVSYVSGGLNCIDANTFDKLQSRAVNEGLAFAALSTVGIVAVGAYGGFLLPAALFAAAIDPYIFMTGYFSSSSFKIFNA